MTDPGGLTTDLVSVGAQSLVDNAQRLGLTWQLRLATVDIVSSANLFTATYDGDENPIFVVSMIGLVTRGNRVYVLNVPPAGNFAVGWVNLDLRHVTNTQNSVSTTASTTFANLSNISGVAFTAPPSGIVTIFYTAQMTNNSAAGGSALTPWIGTGTTVGAGTEILAASFDNALTFQQHATASEILRFGGQTTVSGLTTGDDYNVSMQGAAMGGGGTASLSRIHVTVIPAL